MNTFIKPGLVFVIAGILTISCAYYNTLFNAKRYYRQAERIRNESDSKELPGQARSLYSRVIKKTAKVLKYYPQHKCVDEALLVMGMAFYRQGEYEPALRKFKELTINYPNSIFVGKGFLGMGLIYYSMDNLEKAEEIFNKLLKGADIINIEDIQDDALFMLAEIYKGKNNLSKSIDIYGLVIKQYKKSDKRQQAQYSIAECLFAMGKHGEAFQAYDQVKRYKGTKNMIYKSRYKMGECLIKQDKIHNAVDLYNTLLENEKNEKYFARIKLKLASCHELLQDFKKADQAYERIIQEHPRTAEASEAYYNRGIIYRDHLEDYSKAEEYFDMAVIEYSGTSLQEKAWKQKENLEKFNMYSREIYKDSGDSTILGSRLKLAELYLFTLGKVDSALAQYNFIAEKFPHSEYAPRALYARGWIYENKFKDTKKAKEVYDKILAEYPSSPFSDSLKLRLGFKLEETKNENIAHQEFIKVENARLNNGSSEKIITDYQAIVDNYPGTSSAAKAAYVIAWLADYETYDSLNAIQAYQTLVDSFPRTEYAQKARVKLSYLNAAKNDSSQNRDYDRENIKKQLEQKSKMIEDLEHSPPLDDINPEND